MIPRAVGLNGELESARDVFVAGRPRSESARNIVEVADCEQEPRSNVFVALRYQQEAGEDIEEALGPLSAYRRRTPGQGAVREVALEGIDGVERRPHVRQGIVDEGLADLAYELAEAAALAILKGHFSSSQCGLRLRAWSPWHRR